MSEIPLLDKRNPEDIKEQALQLALRYLPEWSAREGDPGHVLIQLFARLMEIVITRLNRVPEKNFLAFLDTAGIIPRAPGAARAPVRFFPAAGAGKDAFVPRGTQLAATPLAGEQPAAFETEAALVVSASRLVHLLILDPAADHYTELDKVVIANNENRDSVFSPFTGETLMPHGLYLAHDGLFAVRHPARLALHFELVNEAAGYADFFTKGLKWFTGQPAAPVELIRDETAEVVTGMHSITLKFISVKETKQTLVNDKSAYWIQAETREILSGEEALLSITSIKASAGAGNILPELAFCNMEPADLSREVYLFGVKPKLYDAFYLACSEAFSRTGSLVTLAVQYNAGTVGSGGITLAWEFWDGKSWNALTVADNTAAFTANVASPVISFSCPAMARKIFNGKDNYWIRVRITSGNYGTEAKMIKTGAGNTLADWTYTDVSYNPPVLTVLRISYDYTVPQDITSCFTKNHFAYAVPESIPLAAPFAPFRVSPGAVPALYLGFDRSFSNNAVSLFVAVKEGKTAEEPVVVWEYWNGSAWKHLGVTDATRNLTVPGTVTFTGPVDFRQYTIGGKEAYWLRLRCERGDTTALQLAGIYPNTTWVKHSTTLREEILGSSTEKPGAVFTLAYTPVLEGQQIEVREPEKPGMSELAGLIAEEGTAAVTQVITGQTATRECWVRWHEVDHFRFSDQKSRHYIIDRSKGQVMFGDGIRGMIPPAGRDNIRAYIYEAGGGEKGNVQRGAINVLKRAIPFVDRVINVDKAGGGAEGETADDVKISGPQTIKHRDKAVTCEDYEWLARKASLQVARAKCISGNGPQGKVTLVLIPKSDEPKPLLSQGLIRQVNDYLRLRRISTATLVIEGAQYIEIAVSAALCPLDMEQADSVRELVKQRLEIFFHPLKGGPDNKGWEFGRDVYVSEICKVIEDTEGVDHAEDVIILPDKAYVAVGADFVVASGEHKLTITGNR